MFKTMEILLHAISNLRSHKAVYSRFEVFFKKIRRHSENFRKLCFLFVMEKTHNIWQCPLSSSIVYFLFWEKFKKKIRRNEIKISY